MRLVARVRHLLLFLILGTSIAILAIQGHSLHFYNDTHLPETYHLPLWPVELDLKPTVAGVAVGSIVTGLCLIYLLVENIPSVRFLTLIKIRPYFLLPPRQF